MWELRGTQGHPQSRTGGLSPRCWLLHTHMEMPSGFTPSCLAKGRARRCRMPGESLGRSSLWLVNLIFLSDLQQRRRKVQPSLLPVQLQDGSGHWGSRAWQPACPGWHRDRAVPTGSSVPWLWVWHHCCQPHPRPGELTAALQPSGCPRSGDTGGTGLTGTARCRICVTCAQR